MCTLGRIKHGPSFGDGNFAEGTLTWSRQDQVIPIYKDRHVQAKESPRIAAVVRKWVTKVVFQQAKCPYRLETSLSRLILATAEGPRVLWAQVSGRALCAKANNVGKAAVQ